MRQSEVPGEEVVAILREIAEAQLAALEDGELERFLVISGERMAYQKQVVQVALDRVPASATSMGLTEALRGIAHLDQEMSAHLRRMLDETADELRVLRQGRLAVGAYGRPGTSLLGNGGNVDQSW
jgi:hypothetical protein